MNSCLVSYLTHTLIHDFYTKNQHYILPHQKEDLPDQILSFTNYLTSQSVILFVISTPAHQHISILANQHISILPLQFHFHSHPPQHSCYGYHQQGEYQ
jgi:hypothetical protein